MCIKSTVFVLFLLASCLTAQPIRYLAMSGHDPAAGEVAESQTMMAQDASHLSKGSAFMLLFSIVAAVAFHPLGGSLIYGPSIPLWVMAPTSSLIELCLIWFKLGRIHVQAMISLFRDDQPDLELRQEVACLMNRRIMHASEGNRHLKKLNTIWELGGHSQAIEMVRDSIRDVERSFRIRFLVGMSVVAQYLKIIVVSGSGTLLLRVLASLYMLLWATLEAVVLLADRSLSDERIEAHIEEMLAFLMDDEDGRKKLLAEVGEVNLRFESISYLIHQIAFVLISWMIPFVWHGHWMAILCVLIAPWIWFLERLYRYSARLKAFTRSSAGTVSREQAQALISFGGPGVGADIGCFFFIGWILYCAFVYDSVSSHRPDWLWLRWLG